MYRKFKKVGLGLLALVTPSILFSRILRSEALVYYSYFFRTAVLRKLFDTRFSYKHCNFTRVWPLVKMASKTVTTSINYVCVHRLRSPRSFRSQDFFQRSYPKIAPIMKQNFCLAPTFIMHACLDYSLRYSGHFYTKDVLSVWTT